jgi:phosphopantothenoylcysteine synthetase/decarboxylase
MPFEAAAHKKIGYFHVLLITTGSVASIKAPSIVRELLKVWKIDVTSISYAKGVI